MNITVDGVKLDYQISGPADGQPILLIHGFPFSKALWEPMMASLLDFRVIAPDLRGLGRSEPSDETSMASYVDDCLSILKDQHDGRPLTVLGMSMGGYIAFEFFRRARLHVQAMVFLDTRSAADSDEAKKGRFATAETVIKEGSAVVADAMVGKLFAPSAAPELRAKWRDLMSQSNPRGVAAALKAIANRPDSTVTCAKIDVPTLIIVGEEDAITPPEDSRKMNASIAGSMLAVIPQAGHMAAVERPLLVGDAVAEFVRSL